MIVNLHRHGPVVSFDDDGVRMLTFVWTCAGEEVLRASLEDRPGRTFDRSLASFDRMAASLTEAMVADQLAVVTPPR